MTWNPVEAEILEVRKEKHWAGARGSRELEWYDVVEYRYRTPDTGQVVTATAQLRPDDIAVPGQTTTVYVNDADTTESRFERSAAGRRARSCGCMLLALLGFLLAIAGGLALIVQRDVAPTLVFGLAISAPAFVGGVAALLTVRRHLQQLPQDWPALPATVTTAAKEPDPERPGRAQRWLTVHYAYRDHLGQDREGSGLFTHPKATIKRGDAVTVRVDPVDGSRSVLQPASPTLLKVEMGLCVGLILFALVMAVSIIF